MPALAHRATLPRPDDPDILHRIIRALAKGHPLETAGHLAGLGTRVAHEWFALGRQALEDAPPGTPPVELGRHAVFADAVKRGEAAALEKHLSVFNVPDPRPGHWQRSAWMLERRFGNTYSLQQRVHVEQRSVSVTWNLDSLPAAQQAAIAQAVLDAVSAPATSPVTPLLTAPQEQD